MHNIQGYSTLKIYCEKRKNAMLSFVAAKTSFFSFAMCKSLLEEPLCSGQEGWHEEREVPRP